MKKSMVKILLIAFIISAFSIIMCLSASAETQGYYTYTVSDGKAEITKVDDAISGNITIPSFLGGYPVEAVGASAFWYCTKLEGITIGDTVRTIGDEAFSYCKNIKSIIISEKVTKIGRLAFYGTSYYKNAENWESGILYIGKHLIEAKDDITGTHYIKEETLTIADSAFSGCYDLFGVIMPDSVTHINSYAFEYCTNMESAILSRNLIDIGNSAFEYCIKLGYINIPDNVTSIGKRAFADCRKTESVKIGSEVQFIGESAFEGCKRLKDFRFSLDEKNQSKISSMPDISGTIVEEIVLPASIRVIGAAVFPDTIKKVTVYNPECSFDPLCKISSGHIVTGFKGSTAESFARLTGAEFTDIETVHSHNYKTVEMTEPTCVREGIDFKRCICGKETQQLLEKNDHDVVVIEAVSATCISTGLTEGKKCSLCGEVLVPQQTIPKTEHTYTAATTSATLTANGKIEYKCSCGDIEKTETIAKVASLTLSKTKYIYDGKNKTPKVTIKDSEGKVLTKNVDYKLVVASKRAGIGRYTVKVTFMGNYSGTKNLYFYILPGKPATVKSASQSISAIKLSWSAVPGVVGYTVYRYSPSKKAYVKAGTTEGTTLTVSKLLTGTKYTFRVVAYGKTASGKVYDSETYALLKSATKTKTPELTKVTASATKGKAYVYHTNVAGETGYTVYYSTSKTTGFKKYANFKADTTRCDITKLTSGKTYYFKVRTYITTDSGYVYSPFSGVKGVKIK